MDSDEIHDLLDLLGKDLTEGPAHDREILAEDEDLPTVDGPPSSDDTIGVRSLGGVWIAGASQHVEFVERTVVEQIVEPLPGQHLALVVLALDRPLGSGVQRCLPTREQVGKAIGIRCFSHAREGSARHPTSEMTNVPIADPGSVS